MLFDDVVVKGRGTPFTSSIHIKHSAYIFLLFFLSEPRGLDTLQLIGNSKTHEAGKTFLKLPKNNQTITMNAVKVLVKYTH